MKEFSFVFIDRKKPRQLLGILPVTFAGGCLAAAVGGMAGPTFHTIEGKEL